MFNNSKDLSDESKFISTINHESGMNELSQTIEELRSIILSKDEEINNLSILLSRNNYSSTNESRILSIIDKKSQIQQLMI